jgi:hypothetical protein
MTRGIILRTRTASPTAEPTHSPAERRTIRWSGSISSSDSIVTLTEYQGNHDEETFCPNETTQQITIALRTMKEFLFNDDMDKHHTTILLSGPQKQQEQLTSTSSPPPSPLGMVIQTVVGGVYAKYPQHWLCCSEDDDEHDLYRPQLHQMEGEDPALDDCYDVIFMEAFSDDNSSGDSSVTFRYEDLVVDDTPPEDRSDDLIIPALVANGHYHDHEVSTTPQGMVIQVPSVLR